MRQLLFLFAIILLFSTELFAIDEEIHAFINTGKTFQVLYPDTWKVRTGDVPVSLFIESPEGDAAVGVREFNVKNGNIDLKAFLKKEETLHALQGLNRIPENKISLNSEALKRHGVEEGCKGVYTLFVDKTRRRVKHIYLFRKGEHAFMVTGSYLADKGKKEYVEKILDSFRPVEPDLSFLLPVKGNITCRFGYVGKYRWRYFHNAVDVSAVPGTPIKASEDGKVVRVAYARRGYGRYIIIRHRDGFSTRYAHLNSSKVKPGDAVKRGDIIGCVGNTGNTTGPHLHFELRRNGRVVNPMLFIKEMKH